MELTVLGRHGPFPAPGGACSGYLLRAGQAALLLDLGPGTHSRLLAIAPQLDLDCVILSHLHSDHISDMFVLRYALRQFAERGLRPTLPMPVIAPDEPKEEYRLLTASGVFDLAPAWGQMLIDGTAGWVGLLRLAAGNGEYSISPAVATDPLMMQITLDWS